MGKTSKKTVKILGSLNAVNNTSSDDYDIKTRESIKGFTPI
jgi:hypothetical protein